MDKLKKLLFIPLLYHLVIFVLMIALSFTPDRNLNIVRVMLFDMCGVLVMPMFMAVISIIHAILHESKVYDYIYYCLGFLLIIGVARLVIYPLIMDKSMIVVAAGALFVSLGVFVIWDCLFALTDRLMKKSPKRRADKNK